MRECRKICAVTTTRAEYGIMHRLLDKINQNSILQLIVSGAHLSEKYGHTTDEIQLPVTKKIDIEIEKSPAHSMALAIERFDEAFKELKPDIVLILGDRYEIMSAAQAAMLNNIPIAHLHGGETTQGAIDEAIRHCITKMSHLHFTSCDEYKKRVIQLGENPSRVFNFGALGVENIKEMSLLSKDELEKSLDFKFGEKNIIITFHPVTLEKSAKNQFDELLSAVETFSDLKIIITAPNSDSGNEEIFESIRKFENTHNNVKVYKSLGALRYLSCLKYVNAVVGNSSSGIIEAPSFGIATVNIGSRQKGRVRADSVIDCEPDKDSVICALNRAFETDFTNTKNPYEGSDTSKKIFDVLTTFDLSNIIKKEFYDV